MRSKFPSELVYVPGTLGVEMVTVQISFSEFDCFICCVCIPLGASPSTYALYEHAFSSLFSILILEIEDKLLIFGNINLPLVNRAYACDNVNALLPSRISSDVECSLIYLISAE